MVARREFRDARVDLREALLVGARQPGTAPLHALPPDLDQTLLLGREPGALVPHALHAREQAVVVRDLVVQRRQQRGDALRGGGHLAQAVALAVHDIAAVHAFERAAAVLQRLDRVGEGGRRGVGADPLRFAALDLDRRAHGFFDRRRRRARQWRQASVGPGPGGKQRLGAIRDGRVRFHGHPVVF